MRVATATQMGDDSQQIGGASGLAGDGLSKITAVKACDACRRRKIRCAPVMNKDSLGEPVRTCAHCISLGRSGCSFTDPPPRVRKSASSAAAPRSAEDVEALEQRVKSLEGMLESMVAAQAAQPVNGHRPVASASNSQHPTPPESQEALWPRSRELQTDERVIDSLAEDLQSVHIAASTSYLGDESRLRMESTSYGLLPARAKQLATANSNRFLEPSAIERKMTDAESELYKHAFFPLPPADLGRKLLDAYWDHFEPLLELIHRGYFDTCVSKGLLDTEPSFRRLYLIICAMGSRVVEDPRLRPYEGDYCWGWQFFEPAAIPLHILRPNLFDVQADALTGMYLLGNSSWTSVWHVTRDATRKVIDAGIHREDAPYWKSSLLRDQLRKKAFFLLYGLDRITSSALGRPLALHDGDFDVKPPFDIPEDELTALAVADREVRAAGSPAAEIPEYKMAGGRLVMKVMKLEGDAIKLIHQIKTLDAETVSRTLREISAGLDDVEANSGTFIRWHPVQRDDGVLVQKFLSIGFINATRILLHQSFFSAPPPADGSPSPLSVAASAARSMAYTCEAVVDRNLLQTTYFFGPMMAHTAGLVLIIAAVSFLEGKSTASEELLRATVIDVERCVKGLKAWAPLSFIGEKYYESLLHHHGQLQSKLRKHRVDEAPTGSAPPAKRAQQVFTTASSYPPLQVPELFKSPPPPSSLPSNSFQQPGYDPFAGQQFGTAAGPPATQAAPTPDLSAYLANSSQADPSFSSPLPNFDFAQPFPSFMASPGTDPYLSLPDISSSLGTSSFVSSTQDYESAMFDLALLHNFNWQSTE